MNLKTSFFNKSIFKSDIKRFWWTALLEAFVIFISTVIPIYNRCVNYIERSGIGYSYGRFSPEWLLDGGIIFLIAFSLGIPVMLFSYMHFSASMSMHHSLPVKRSQLLWTKIITGLILTITPILINGAVFGAILTAPEYRELIGVMPVIRWCISGILYTAVIFTLTVAVNMMTGHPVGALIFTVGFAVLPSIIVIFLEGFFSVEYFGYSGSNMSEILNYLYPNEEWLITFPTYLIYILMSVGFTVGAYFLYKHRKLEAHGEVAAGAWLKVVFIVIVGMLSSMLSWAYFNGTLGFDGVFWLIPLGVIGTVIAWMISRKSLSLKGVHKTILVYLAVTLLVGIAVHFDITGYETKVPELNDIKSVHFGHKDSDEKIAYVNGEKIKYKLRGGIETSFTSEEDIRNVTELHKALVKDKEKSVSGQYVPIEYTLKNGKTITRAYNIDYEKYAEYLKPVYETPEMRATVYDIIDGTEKEYINLEIHDRRIAGTKTIYPDNPDMNKVIDALKMDMAGLDFEDMTTYSDASLSVSVVFKHIVDFDTPIPDGTEPISDSYLHISITDGFVNTKALLEEMGIYDKIPVANDIEKVEISTWINKWEDNTRPVSEKEEQSAITVTDRDEISAIYDEYDKMIGERKYTDIDKAKNIRIVYYLKSGHVFDVSCSYDDEKIPEVFQKYFN